MSTALKCVDERTQVRSVALYAHVSLSLSLHLEQSRQLGLRKFKNFVKGPTRDNLSFMKRKNVTYNISHILGKLCRCSTREPGQPSSQTIFFFQKAFLYHQIILIPTHITRFG